MIKMHASTHNSTVSAAIDCTSRLTWDGSKIAPYESAWMTFNKIIALNYINFVDLAKLISKNKVYSISKKDLIIKAFNGEWIDYQRYSTLIGVDQKALQMGFSTYYGIETASDNEFSIRHCPECLTMGYHSIIFQFASVSNCPWHRCVLTKKCSSCIMESAISGRNTNGNGPRIECLRCRSINVDFSQSVSTNKLTADLSSVIREKCEAFFDWRQRIISSKSYSPYLFSELFLPPQTLPTHIHSIPWKLRFVSDMLSTPSYIQPREERCRIRHTTVKVGCQSPHFSASSFLTNETLLQFSEIEKNLKKKIGKCHKGCIDKLINYSNAERLKLDGTKVCRVALAYWAWKIAITGKINLAKSQTFEREIENLKMMAPKGNLAFNVSELLEWTRLSFSGILYKLGELCDNRSVILFRSAHLCSDGFLVWATDSAASFKTPGTKRLKDSSVEILYPDLDDLLSTEDERCSQRDRFRQEMHRPFIVQAEKNWFGGHGVIFKVLLENQLDQRNYYFLEL